jgi:hypothetical protein
MEKMNLKILILNQIKRIKKSNKYKVKIKKKKIELVLQAHQLHLILQFQNKIIKDQLMKQIKVLINLKKKRIANLAIQING